MCSTTKTPCVYPVPEGLSRSQAQKQKFTDVSRAHESSRRVLELLSASQDGASHDILQQLKHSKHLDNTIQSIADASLLLPRSDGDDEMGDPPVTTPQPEDNMLADTAQNLTGSIGRSLRSLSAESTDTSIILPVSRWTTVLKDDRILTQLLEIFWAWEGTLSRLVVRDLFSAELSNADAQQKHQFCSPLLVNAILAVSSLHSTRKHSSLHTDAKNIAQKFADCAFDLLDAEEDVSSLTLLQGATVLWVYCSNEGTRVSRTRAARLAGLMLRTWSTLGLGTDGSNLFHQPETQPTNDLEMWQAVSYIAWGFYCFFAKASLVCSPHMLISKPLIMKIFEAQDGLSAGSLGSASSAGDIHLINQTWNAYQLQVLTAECSLCEIIDQFVSGFVTNDTQRPILDSGRCTALYNKLLLWKLSLPDELMTSDSVLPSTLLLQRDELTKDRTTYDFVALKLLATFTSQSGPDFDGRNAVSLQTLHASSMISNLWIYRGLYTLKYEYWAAEHCSFAVHTLLPQIAEPAVRDTIAKACCVLHEMGIQSGLSGRAAELLRDIEGTARTRGIRIPPYGKGSKSPEVDAKPTFVVNGARVFDGSGGGLVGDADENVWAVSFDSTIGDVRLVQPY
ncbi:C6 transcription factor [Colletotrichum asianum]|uniref:C6 transcription factor n=1 Tax=Colletotrichum asianum TaxID=702518 RepID=A0A8H3W2T8_9PEZI|nr:C6 transcription factor [Colletotrichum asianum]